MNFFRALPIGQTSVHIVWGGADIGGERMLSSVIFAAWHGAPSYKVKDYISRPLFTDPDGIYLSAVIAWEPSLLPAHVCTPRSEYCHPGLRR